MWPRVSSRTILVLCHLLLAMLIAFCCGLYRISAFHNLLTIFRLLMHSQAVSLVSMIPLLDAWPHHPLLLESKQVQNCRNLGFPTLFPVLDWHWIWNHVPQLRYSNNLPLPRLPCLVLVQNGNFPVAARAWQQPLNTHERSSVSYLLGRSLPTTLAYIILYPGMQTQILVQWHQAVFCMQVCSSVCFVLSPSICTHTGEQIKKNEQVLRPGPCWLSEMRMMSSLCIMGFLQSQHNGVHWSSDSCDLSHEPHRATSEHIEHTSTDVRHPWVDRAGQGKYFSLLTQQPTNLLRLGRIYQRNSISANTWQNFLCHQTQELRLQKRPLESRSRSTSESLRRCLAGLLVCRKNPKK